MPSKKGKAKGKGKGKGKGKAKGKGKGKGKDGNLSEKKDKEAALKQAVSDAKLWEMRFQAAEKSREAYRESGRKLMQENDLLQSAISQTEKDTVKVIGFLKKEGGKKDEEVVSLRGELCEAQETAASERRELAQQYKSTVEELEVQLQDRTEELSVMQGELKTVKEFRKHRGEMEAQLSQLQVTLAQSKKDHQAALQALEHRFFEEKVRLQKEANSRIAELSEKAHSEAVRNLGDRTRDVYHENVRMSEALALHSARVEELELRTQQLEVANRQLAVEKELNQQLVASRVEGARRHQKQISELQEKVSSLEASLVAIVKEFDVERERQTRHAQLLLQEAREEAESQRSRANCEAAKLSHIRSLAQRILQQRSEVEHFLLDALQHVKREVVANRSQYCHDAAVIYHGRVREAARGHGQFPAVRTFRALPSSTNSVYHDLDTAAQWEGISGRVDISDLTWEQKEQVLRLLFSRINKTTPSNSQPPPHSSPSTCSPPPPPPSRDVFLTQSSSFSATNPPQIL